RRDDLKARCAEKERLDALRVVQTACDAAAVGDPDDDGASEVVVGTVAEFGRLVDDLIHRGVDEVSKLDLRDGKQSAYGGADGDPDNAGFGQGRIDDPVFAKLIQKPLGCVKDAAMTTHVFAQDHHSGVAAHLLKQGGTHGFEDVFNGQRRRSL